DATTGAPVCEPITERTTTPPSWSIRTATASKPTARKRADRLLCVDEEMVGCVRVHFQDKGPYGRVVHLEPMKWVDDWPVIGNDGMPVASYRKPNVGKPPPRATPADSDEFNSPTLGLLSCLAALFTCGCGLRRMPWLGSVTAPTAATSRRWASPSRSSQAAGSARRSGCSRWVQSR